jgi:hypothetical protein
MPIISRRSESGDVLARCGNDRSIACCGSPDRELLIAHHYVRAESAAGAEQVFQHRCCFRNYGPTSFAFSREVSVPQAGGTYTPFQGQETVHILANSGNYVGCVEIDLGTCGQLNRRVAVQTVTTIALTLQKPTSQQIAILGGADVVSATGIH